MGLREARGRIQNSMRCCCFAGEVPLLKLPANYNIYFEAGQSIVTSVRAHTAHQTTSWKVEEFTRCLQLPLKFLAYSIIFSLCIHRQVNRSFINSKILDVESVNQWSFCGINLEFCNPFQLGFLTSLRQRESCNQCIKLYKEQPGISCTILCNSVIKVYTGDGQKTNSWTLEIKISWSKKANCFGFTHSCSHYLANSLASPKKTLTFVLISILISTKLPAILTQIS